MQRYTLKIKPTSLALAGVLEDAEAAATHEGRNHKIHDLGVYVHVYIHTYIYIHICVYIYVYDYIYVYMYMCVSNICM